MEEIHQVENSEEEEEKAKEKNYENFEPETEEPVWKIGLVREENQGRNESIQQKKEDTKEEDKEKTETETENKLGKEDTRKSILAWAETQDQEDEEGKTKKK